MFNFHLHMSRGKNLTILHPPSKISVPNDQPSFISNCMHVIIQMRQICAAYCTYKYSLILLQRSNRLAYLCTNSPIFVSISSPFFFAHVKLTSKWPIGHQKKKKKKLTKPGSKFYVYIWEIIWGPSKHTHTYISPKQVLSCLKNKCKLKDDP